MAILDTLLKSWPASAKMTAMIRRLEVVRSRPLLERESASDALESALSSAAAGTGRMLAIDAEAGGGKTAFLESFREGHPQVRTLWGACDALATPRPLSPLLDIRSQCEEPLARLISAPTSTHDLADAILVELGRISPTVLVIEDVHWADEATLDLIRVLARRIETVPALAIVSFRSELATSHPLLIALGDLVSSARLQRLTLPSLSAKAVAKLVEGFDVDAVELYERTGGNPFFVTEAIASLPERIPTTVREAVLARAGRLSTHARSVLETLAVMPQLAEHWLLERLIPAGNPGLEECLASGMLVADTEGVRFRHELARESVEAVLSPRRRRELNRSVLRALIESVPGSPDLARLAHHAELAGDGEAVLQFAAAAGESAAAAGAHREAAAQFARAIRWADAQPPEFRVSLFERRATECFLTDDRHESISAIAEAISLQEMLQNPRREGELLASMSRMLWCAGRVDDAWSAAREAIQLLDPLGTSRELGRACAALSMVHLNDEDGPATAEWGARALVIARSVGDVETEVQVLNNLGTVRALQGDEEGFASLHESLRLADQAGLDEHVGRAWTHMAWAAGRNRQHAREASYFEGALSACREGDLDLWLLHVLGLIGWSCLQQGRWQEAADHAARVIVMGDREGAMARLNALSTLGLLRARRGDPDHQQLLDEAEEIAAASGQIQHLLPVAWARAEIAWLQGRIDGIREATDTAFELAVRKGSATAAAEIARWRVRAGVRTPLNGSIPLPYRMEIEGCWAAAAEEWNTLGCRYEAALAQVEAGTAELLRAALQTFDDLGAGAARNRALRKLRELGVQGIPVGPRLSTRKNPHGLTRREAEILHLLNQGCSNSEIAAKLVLSTRTVDHHVSNILAKLGAKTRTEAVRRAAEPLSSLAAT